MKPRSGTIEALRTGRFGVRVTMPDGTRRRVGGTYASREEAEVARETIVDDLGLEDIEASTLATYGPAWLDRRERAGKRATADVRSIWRTWVETAPFYRRPIRTLSRRELRDWMLEIRAQRAEQTARNALNVLRRCLADAVDDGLAKDNVARDIRVDHKPRTAEPWTYLQRDEITRLLDECTLDERLVVAFAIGTGLRSGEQRALRLADVDVTSSEPHVMVRYGSPPDLPTKTGKIRRVPLFGLALDAATQWLAQLDEFAALNDKGLMFPTMRGVFRRDGHVLGREHRSRVYRDRFASICEHAGLLVDERPLTWHSLRHTCASALVSGYWGRAWSLGEVKELLGHQSVTTTERYAHLAGTALTRAAAEHQSSTNRPQPRSRIHETPYFSAPPTRIERVANGLGNGPETRFYASFQALREAGGRLVDAGARGDSATAWRAAQDLARMVLDTCDLDLARSVLAGGPHWFRQALDLADFVTEHADATGEPAAASPA